ncbi:MAG: heterodisulfide reductase-related iron-sulfur binding cluster [Dehalococcoidia bacterium]|nr:heterodisulfide reductase-related iron-sulfur binding cluster [Dehalococcoidia bacterium]
MKKNLKLTDIAKGGDTQLTEINIDKLIPLPPPYDKVEELSEFKQLTEEQKERLVCNLDGVVSTALPKPQNKEEEKKYVEQFVSGLKKLLSKENNWTFLQPLLLSIDYCAQCQTCCDACPVYLASGKNDLYRPTYRSEIFRRLVNKYVKPGGKLWAKLSRGDIELNWTTITRLYELSYRCTLCRRCAQFCPLGVDNGLITRELRKLFSQELGWAPKELHEKGTVLQLEVGSPTGMKPHVAKDNLKFLDEDFTEATGIEVSTSWDKEGADILLIHSAGDIVSFPENPIAFSILCNAAGISWTLSSEIPGYDGVNYGVFYDDVQLAKVAIRHAQIAKKLKVKKIVMGECGHQHKAFMTVADRMLTGDLNIPRESVMTFLEDLVFSGKIKFDPSKNDFPVTLHDPCNIVRNLGIVEPQRRILRYLCPQFREMTPHGVDNYCCGGGGGLSVMSDVNFTDWKVFVAGRMKFKQILEAFEGQLSPEIKKYLCAPCLNCKLQFRDLFEYYGAKEKSNIIFGGIAELIVNAMVDIKKPFITWGEDE